MGGVISWPHYDIDLLLCLFVCACACACARVCVCVCVCAGAGYIIFQDGSGSSWTKLRRSLLPLSLPEVELLDAVWWIRRSVGKGAK